MKVSPLLHVVLEMHLMPALLEQQELVLVLMVHPKQIFLVLLKHLYH
jgi:hypothetical protein